MRFHLRPGRDTQEHRPQPFRNPDARSAMGFVETPLDGMGFLWSRRTGLIRLPGAVPGQR